MLWTLVASALLMGIAGTPHCLAMCGAPCMAITRGSGADGLSRQLGFHLARLGSYAAAGAVAAAGVGGIAVLAQAAPALRPLWTLVHVGALALGVWLFWQGRQPAWVEGWGRGRPAESRLAVAGGGRVAAGVGQPVTVVERPAQSRAKAGPLAAAGAGLLWVAWPCALLQSALVVSALAGGAAEGAMVMATFAAASAIGLVAGPALWLRLAGSRAGAGQGARWAVRMAGLALALGSAWALGHGLWQRVLTYCFG